MLCKKFNALCGPIGAMVINRQDFVVPQGLPGDRIKTLIKSLSSISVG